MSERVRVIDHRGVNILFLDFSGLADVEGVLAVIAEARPRIDAAAPQSLLTLTDVTGTSLTTAIAEAMKAFAEANGPHVRAGALLGVTGLKQVAFNTIKRLSGRVLRAFDSADQARDWLVGEAGRR